MPFCEFCSYNISIANEKHLQEQKQGGFLTMKKKVFIHDAGWRNDSVHAGRMRGGLR